MISEVPYFDVSREDRNADRRTVTAFYAVPKGSRVMLFLGSRQHVPTDLLSHLARDYVMDLSIEFIGDPDITARSRVFVHECLYGAV